MLPHLFPCPSLVSRLAQDLLTDEERELAGRSRDTLAVYRKNQDLISIGAYQRGSNPAIDSAIQKHDPLNQFLKQDVRETVLRKDGWDQLKNVMGTTETVKLEITPETRPDLAPQAPIAPQMPMMSSGLAGMHMAQQPMVPVAGQSEKGD